MTELLDTFARLIQDGTVDKFQHDYEAIAREVYGRVQMRVSPKNVPAFIDKARTLMPEIASKIPAKSKHVKRRELTAENAAHLSGRLRQILAAELKKQQGQPIYMNARNIQRKYFNDDMFLGALTSINFGRLLANLTREQHAHLIRVELGKGRPVKYKITLEDA